VIGSAFLDGRDHYERIFDGRVDNTHPDAFTHTARFTDDDGSIEVVAVVTPSPDYEIREARFRVLSGSADPSLADAVTTLAGVGMVGGFTRRAREAVGERRGGSQVVDAAIEIARLARQVAKLPPERAARAAGGNARACWELDVSGWIDLPGSCFTYTAAGRALFDTRTVTAQMRPELYAPPLGLAGVFQRRKVARLERDGARLTLRHSMHDDVHGFEITYEVDAESGRILRAESSTPRLPYMGICSEPQQKIASLVGLRVDGELRKSIQILLGGSTGCAQLYDLTSDLLKLLRLEEQTR
jgi:hypothetical protein